MRKFLVIVGVISLLFLAVSVILAQGRRKRKGGKNSMRIALVQLPCEWNDVEGNMKHHQAWIKKAAEREADLVVFPEMSVHGLMKDHMVRVLAESIDGPIVETIKKWAKESKIAVGFGMAERAGEAKPADERQKIKGTRLESKPYNCYVLIDRNGEMVGAYRKNYVYIVEQEFYRCAARRPVFTLNGVTIAIAICCDTCHVELLDSYVSRGAKIILMPHAWDAGPIMKPERGPGWTIIEELVAAHACGDIVGFKTHDQMLKQFVSQKTPGAKKHGVYYAFVNQTGRPHPLIPFVGPSFVMGPSGKVIAQSKDGSESMLVVDIEF